MKSSWWFAAFALVAHGCSCSNTSAFNEKPPADLASKGFIVDGPADGASVSGAWVTVSGWASPDSVSGVAVLGAPVDGFYNPTGHVGVPTVPVTLRKDGRFFAPRVPLQDGGVKITIIPFGKGGSSYEAITRTVTASGTKTVPATLVIDPPQPAPGQKATLRASNGKDLSTSFQWDFDGDGTFDAEGASVTHAWSAEGRYQVIARAKGKDGYVSAYAKVTISSLPKVLASASVDSPTRMVVLPKYIFPGDPLWPDGGMAPDWDDIPKTAQYVAVIDGDAVKVFDAALKPLFTLTGLSDPHDVQSDHDGNLYVADTGNGRIVRFTPTGQLDTAWHEGGSFRGYDAGVHLQRPLSLSYAAEEILEDGNSDIWCIESRQICEHSEEQEAAWKRLGLKSVTRLIQVPQWNTGEHTSGFIADGKFIEQTPLETTMTKVEAIDAALSYHELQGHTLAIGPDGVLRRYVLYDELVSTWKLPYKACCVGHSLAGETYVAGEGVVELRDYPRILK